MSNITTVLKMAETRIHNTLLDCDVIGAVFVCDNKLIIELTNGRNFELSKTEVKHQAKEFIEENY
jgi:nitrate/TMAO reductase-like tetraheme cytochrome c subunit